MGFSSHPCYPYQCPSDAEVLHVANELIRRDVAHEIKDVGGFNLGRLSQDSNNLFRLIDDEPPSYLKKRETLVSFISQRHPQSAKGFSILPDLQAKYFTGKSRKWRNIYAILSVLTPNPAAASVAADQRAVNFATVLVFENEFGGPSFNLTLSGGGGVQASKVLKVVSLKPGAPVLGFQAFDGTPGDMSEVEVFVEFSSEEIQNDWLMKLCEIDLFPALESPSEDSGFFLRQEIADGAAQQLKCVPFSLSGCFWLTFLCAAFSYQKSHFAAGTLSAPTWAKAWTTKPTM